MSKNEKKQEVGMFNALPKLSEQKPQGISLVAEYWNPDAGEVGAEKRVYVAGVALDFYEDEERGRIELPCVLMIEETEKGEHKAVKNGAKRLVAAIEDAIKAGKIVTTQEYEETGVFPTGILITYLGRKKNKNNQFQSDRFDVRLLS